MTHSDFYSMVFGGIVGGSGIIGLAFFFLRRYIEKKLKASENEAKKRRDIKIKRMKIEDEMHHAYGRLHFWEVRAIESGTHNGELKTAMNNLEIAEEKKKCLDREIIAESEQDC